MSRTSKTIIASSSIVLLFVALVVFSIIRNTVNIPDGTIGNTSGNIYNHGLFAECGDKVYFSNPYDSGKLYSMNYDHTDITKLSDQRASYINATEDFVFFAGRNTDTSTGFGSILKKPNLCMIRLKSGKLKVLSQEPSQSMILIGSTLYYQHYTQKDGENFCSMDVNKRKPVEELDYLINPASYYNGTFYFNGLYDDHFLYSFKPQSKQVLKLWEGEIWNPIVDGDYVYFMDIRNDYRICRYSLSANTIEILEKERVDCFNYYNGIIYYQVSSKTNPRLMRMNADGTNQELVCEGIFSEINITSRYAYFSSYNEGIPTYYTPTFSSIDVREFKPLQIGK